MMKLVDDYTTIRHQLEEDCEVPFRCAGENRRRRRLRSTGESVGIFAKRRVGVCTRVLRAYNLSHKSATIIRRDSLTRKFVSDRRANVTQRALVSFRRHTHARASRA